MFNKAQITRSPLPSSLEQEPNYVPMIMHTEVLTHGDPREPLFYEEKRKELEGLLKRGVFKICLKEEAGENPNVIPSRFVLAIKHSQNDDEPPRLKARFVLGGHRDKDKDRLVHDTKTVRTDSFRLLIALGTLLGLRLSLIDWKQGYAQCDSKLLRRVFIRPKELELKMNELVQIMKPVYGLSDAGDYWASTLTNHLQEHCRFKQVATDLALWFKSIGGKLRAMAATYVDDVLLASTPAILEEFRKVSNSRFDLTIDTRDVLYYLGIRITTHRDGTRSISQPKQISRL